MNKSDTSIPNFQNSTNSGQNTAPITENAVFLVPFIVCSVGFCVFRRIYKGWKAAKRNHSKEAASTLVPSLPAAFTSLYLSPSIPSVLLPSVFSLTSLVQALSNEIEKIIPVGWHRSFGIIEWTYQLGCCRHPSSSTRGSTHRRYSRRTIRSATKHPRSATKHPPRMRRPNRYRSLDTQRATETSHTMTAAIPAPPSTLFEKPFCGVPACRMDPTAATAALNRATTTLPWSCS